MRENTERPITVEQGTNTLVGRDYNRILSLVDEILVTGGKRGRTPELLDGRAAERIAEHPSRWLAERPAPVPAWGARMTARIANALTKDVADDFRVSVLARHIPRSEWDRISCWVEGNIHLVLALLAESHSKAILFTLGWIARRNPRLVRRTVTEGHELASPGYGNLRATDQSFGRISPGYRHGKVVPGRPRRHRSQGLSRSEIFGWCRKCLGFRLHCRGRLPLQLERLPATAPRRHAHVEDRGERRRRGPSQ